MSSAQISVVASHIDEITVYRRGARVRRVAKLTVAGTGEARLVGLPLSLDDDSVRVAVTGPATASGVRVALEATTGAHVDPVDVRAVEDARQAVKAAEVEVARLERILTELERLSPMPTAEHGEDEVAPEWSVLVDTCIAAHELRSVREAALRTALAAARRTVEELRVERDLAEDRLRRASTARRVSAHELRKSLIVGLRGDGDGGEIELSVEYLVPGARWAPTYVARLGGGRAGLELRATVAQSTGEDWDGVALRLSTAAALRFTELPELMAQRIGRKQPPPRTGWRPPPVGIDALYADWDRAFAGRRQPPVPVVPEPAPAWDVMKDTRVPPSNRLTPPLPMPAVVVPPPAAAAPSMMQGMAFSAGAPAPGAAPAPQRAAKTMAFRMDAPSAPMPPPPRNEGAAAVTGAAAVAGELTAPADLLAYGELMLPAPAAADRGRLVRVGRRERYRTLLSVTGIDIDVDVLDVVGRAVTLARAVEALPLPQGARDQWTDSYDYAYRADGRVDVPSDGQWHQVAMATRDAAIAIRHVVVPRESTSVFRVGALTSPFESPLLPGPMDVYDGKDFLTTTAIALTPPGGKLELGLGVDQRVKTTRVTEYREESEGLLRGARRLQHVVTVTVDNLADRAIELEVRERVPVAPEGNDDISVEVARSQPAWEPWRPAPTDPHQSLLRGGYRWRLAVDPAQRRELVAEYHVKIAAKNELTGGNRRES